MYILITTQRGKCTHHISNITPSFTQENALIALHILPLLLLSINPKIILGPLYCKYSLKKPLDCESSNRRLKLLIYRERTKKLVQLQIKVINLFSSFALITLLVLIIPIMITSTNAYKSDKYPYIKSTVSCAFIQNRLFLNYVHTSGIVYHTIHHRVLNMIHTFRSLYQPILQIPTPLPHYYTNSCYSQQPLPTFYGVRGGRNHIFPTHRVMIWKNRRKHSCSPSSLT
eukprot:bmy_13336T0